MFGEVLRIVVLNRVLQDTLRQTCGSGIRQNWIDIPSQFPGTTYAPVRELDPTPICQQCSQYYLDWTSILDDIPEDLASRRSFQHTHPLPH